MLNRAALSAAVITLAACAGHDRAPALHLANASEIAVEAEPTPPSEPHGAQGGYPVLVARGRLFVLLGEHAPRPSSATDRWLLAGGWALELGDVGPAPEAALTVVGPSSRCTGKAGRTLSLTLDLGGYAAASLPLETERAIEVDGCASLAAQGEPLVAFAVGGKPAPDAHAMAGAAAGCEVRVLEDTYCLLKR